MARIRDVKSGAIRGLESLNSAARHTGYPLNIRSSEKFYRIELDFRYAQRLDSLARPVSAQVAVAVRRRFSVDLDGFSREIDQPHFGDAVARIKRYFDSAVVGERSVRHFDQQMNIFRTRVGVEVTPVRYDGEIRLRFGLALETDRVPHSYDRGAPLDKKPGQSADGFRVSSFDRRHIDDLSLDEFQSIVFRENSGVSHAVVFVDRDAMAPREFMGINIHEVSSVVNDNREFCTFLPL